MMEKLKMWGDRKILRTGVDTSVLYIHMYTCTRVRRSPVDGVWIFRWTPVTPNCGSYTHDGN